MALSELDKVLKEIDKECGGIVETGVERNDYDRIPFSSPRLNYMTFGGLPLGHIIEFSGPEGSGKSSSATDIMKNAQIKFKEEAKKNGTPEKKVVLFDVEGTFDYTWAAKFGLDTKKIIRLKFAGWSAKDVLDNALKVLSTGEVGLLVIDSIAALVPDQLEGKGVGDKIYGGIAQSLQNFCNKVKRYLVDYNAMVICINQVRDNLNSMFGGTVTPGGRGFKHATSIRMEFRKGKFIDKNNKELTNSAENPAGNLINVVILKSKVFPSTRRVGYYTLKYLTGPDILSDYIDVGLQVKVIEQKGAFYDIVNLETGEVLNKKKIQGRNNLKEELNKHKDWLDLINKEVEKKDISELVDEETLAEANKVVANSKE